MDDETLLRVLAGHGSTDDINAVDAWRQSTPDAARRWDDMIRLRAETRDWYDQTPSLPQPSAASLLVRANARNAARVTGLRGRKATWLYPAASIAAAVAIVIAGARFFKHSPSEKSPTQSTLDIRGPESGTIPVRLNDGTLIALGPQSHLRVALNRESREVWLEGRAEFSVVHMTDRPFHVQTAVGEATDLGTRFVVRTDEGTMRIAVFDGRVALASNGKTVQLGAGDVGNVVKGESPGVAHGANIRSSEQWLSAALILDGASLAVVAREFQLRDHYTVIVRDSALAQQTISAWFPTRPSAPEALTAICRAVGATCRVSDSSTIISP
jgi:transmembrane sensor